MTFSPQTIRNMTLEELTNVADTLSEVPQELFQQIMLKVNHQMVDLEDESQQKDDEITEYRDNVIDLENAMEKIYDIAEEATQDHATQYDISVALNRIVSVANDNF